MQITNHSDTALFVIDVQQGMFVKSTPVFHAAELLENIRALIERAHQACIPVYYLQHTNDTFLAEMSDGWQIHPSIQPSSVDIVIRKRRSSAFKEPALCSELKSQPIRRLVITGLVTQGCVQAACLDALKIGYRVLLAADGHSTFHKRAGELIDEWNTKLRQEGVEVKPTQEIEF